MGFLSKISSMVGRGEGQSDKAVPEIDKSVLLDKIKQTELFARLPSENLEDILSHMESVTVKAGDSIVKEGEEGDYYYLMVNGSADVTKTSDAGGAPRKVARLEGPTGFGEEALISNAKRNATVTMVSDGVLMRLSKDDFNDNIKEPLVDWFSPAEAQRKTQGGARWLDVRPLQQSEKKHLHDAILIPIEDLRVKMAELDKSVSYVCYCQNGRLSSTAAFLLKQEGYEAGVLRGGVQNLE